MIRRTRRPKEIPFSFDSFLDVVANVVGIIIKLILVVWLGARSYSSVQNLIVTPTEKPVEEVTSKELQDPLQHELARHRQEMAEAQTRLLEQLRQLKQTKEDQQQLAGKIGKLLAECQELERAQNGFKQSKNNQQLARQQSEMSLAELRQRQVKLLDEIKAMEKLPPLKQVLRYRTPVSKPVNADEFFFECNNGRVTFIDIASLMAEMRHAINEKSQVLRNQWEVTDTTISVGAFRLRYTLERQKEYMDSVTNASPDGLSSYSYGLDRGVFEPVTMVRGETIQEALAEGSQFRQVVDLLDTQQAVVTFWVYPDSFTLYRQLRDYLYERDVVVAGRPLPEGTPIACSRKGSRSRGQ